MIFSRFLFRGTLLSQFIFTLFNIAKTNADSNFSYVVAAYYENYSQYRPSLDQRPPFSLTRVDPNLLTDLYFAFGTFGYITKGIDPSSPHLTGDFTLQPTEANDLTVLYPQVRSLKKASQGRLKTFLSVGGWNFNDQDDPQGVGKITYRLFSQMVSNPTHRKQFIDSAIQYAHQQGFDGIDIDWEYPGDPKRGGSIDDFSNFTLFLKEASEAFSKATPPLMISFAAPGVIPWGLPEPYQSPERYFRWIAECSLYVDRINLMAYSYHGPFADPKITGVNAPLNRDTNSSSLLYIAKTLQNYLEYGVPAKKIVLGIPTFGHTYAGVSDLTQNNMGPGKPFESPGPPGAATKLAGFLAYFEISDLIAKKQLNFGTDTLTNTAIAYDVSSERWVSFDTPETVKLKAQIALKLGLRGVMFWSLDNDEYHWEPRFPNIQSAKNVFYELKTPKDALEADS
jgi:GH18 family chitinase